ncbi:MAG: GNAT family N-acetyltransferase [Gemmatimonadota bacterium]|nr:GNAT family N-acetyltransferase [Gemmatimonadota bacterium]
MAIARSWRSTHQADGPYPARIDDVPALNQVFSDAFTERYRRDGMVGVRVPHLNPLIWRYAIEDADGGALVWRDEHDDIVAFNIVHRSGVEGWMGPLAVRADRQSSGMGKDIVRAGIDWLRDARVTTIGLETMPRTMDNIGFYSGLGFVPGRLTITLTLDATTAERAPTLLSRVPRAEKAGVLAECHALVTGLLSGYDFTRELVLTEQLGLGDTVLLRAAGRVRGFALCHSVPLVEGRAREEMRVLKLVVEREEHLSAMVQILTDFARRSGARRAAFRVQTDYLAAYRLLVRMGARVRWTDLRMTIDEYPERRPESGIVWSNWEI